MEVQEALEAAIQNMAFPTEHVLCFPPVEGHPHDKSASQQGLADHLSPAFGVRMRIRYHNTPLRRAQNCPDRSCMSKIGR